MKYLFLISVKDTVTFARYLRYNRTKYKIRLIYSLLNFPWIYDTICHSVDAGALGHNATTNGS